MKITVFTSQKPAQQFLPESVLILLPDKRYEPVVFSRKAVVPEGYALSAYLPAVLIFNKKIYYIFASVKCFRYFRYHGIKLIGRTVIGYIADALIHIQVNIVFAKIFALYIRFCFFISQSHIKKHT